MACKKAILVIGAGGSTRGAIDKCFAKERCIACVTRRTFSWTHEMEIRSWMDIAKTLNLVAQRPAAPERTMQ